MKGRELLTSGTRIGDFRILDVIAQGGSGVLYRGVRINETGEEDALYYAIKEVGLMESETARHALANEKKITQGMENYSGFSIVIPILQVMTREDMQYAVMPYKRSGMFLSQLITDLEKVYGTGKIPVSVIFSLTNRILQSLSILQHSSAGWADQEGYLHLDIQPANIFVENVNLEKMEFGSVKFIDLQNAVPIRDGYGVRQTAEVYASVGYAAPEMLRSGKRKLNRATDLYSVGCIMARMLTGEEISYELDHYLDRVQQDHWCLKRMDLDAATRCLLKKLLLCALEPGMEMRYQLVWEMEQDLSQAQSCYQAFLAKDYYAVFAKAWDMLIKKEEISAEDMGWDIWGFNRSVKQLEKALLQDHVCPVKCAYIYDRLREMKLLHEKEVDAEIKVSLLSSGISCANHQGNSILAVQLFEEMEQYKAQVPIMDYLASVNRAAEMYADMADYETAYQMASRNVASYSYIKEAYQKAASWNHIAGTASTELTGLGRSLSAQGRYEAFLGKTEAMESFDRAIAEFEEDEGNCRITRDHRMHAILELKDKKLWEKYAPSYWKHAKDMTQQLSELLSSSRIPLFSLWVLLKYAWILGEEEITEEFIRLLVECLENETLEAYPYYPTSLIYKYMALILLRYDEETYAWEAEQTMELAFSCEEEAQPDPSRVMTAAQMTGYHILFVQNHLLGADEWNAGLLEDFKDALAHSGWTKALEELEERTKGEIDYLTLNGFFRYELC